MKKIALFLILMAFGLSLAYAETKPAEEPSAKPKVSECKTECNKKYAEAAKGCAGSSNPNCFQGAQQDFSACSSACPA